MELDIGDMTRTKQRRVNLIITVLDFTNIILESKQTDFLYLILFVGYKVSNVLSRHYTL